MIINLQKVIAGVGETLSIDGAIEPYVTEEGEVNEISVAGYVKNFSGRLELHMDIKGVYHTFCSRCTSETEFPLEIHLDDRFVREPTDEDFIVLENNNFNVTSYVHEEIALHLPMRVLCNQDCKGLCGFCGANLNESPCKCVSEEIDSRFEKLKKLLDKKEE